MSFSQENFARTKKSTKSKQATFTQIFCLRTKKHEKQISDFRSDVFYVDKKQTSNFHSDVLFIRVKNIKSIKSAKSTKSQTSDFLVLRCFLFEYKA